MVALSGSSNQRGFLALRRPNFSIDRSNSPNRSQNLDLQSDHIVWDQIKRIFESVRWVSRNSVHISVTRATLIFLSWAQSANRIDHPLWLETLENLIWQPDHIVWDHIKRIFESVQWVSRNSVHKSVTHGWQFSRIWAELRIQIQLDFGERATAYNIRENSSHFCEIPFLPE